MVIMRRSILGERFSKSISLFAIYVLTCSFSLWMQSATGMGTQAWPAAGVAFAAFLIWGTYLWPVTFLGTVVVHWIRGDPFFPFLGPALGNTLEPLTAAWICSKHRGFQGSLSRPRDVMGLVVGASVLSTLLGAATGVSWLALSGYDQINWDYFFQYWAGDALGILLVAPLILVFSVPSEFARFRWQSLKTLEGAAFLLMALAVTGLFARMQGPARLYFFFPTVIWVAIRLGQRGVTVATLFFASIMIWATANGRGPFATSDGRIIEEIYLYTFVAALQVTGLLFASVEIQRESETAAREQQMRDSQEALRALNAKLEEAVRFRDEFLTIASHELKTPMTPLRLHFQMIRRQYQNEAALRRQLENCDRSLMRLTRLTDELLTVSRISSGRLTLNREEMDLGQLFREIAEQYRYELERVQSPLSLNIADGVVGFWDRTRLEEVIVNLLTNALKFNGGHPIEITVDRFGGDAKFSVHDNGIGIPPEDTARIFQRFERGSGVKNVGGLGLGLYITKQIVEAHGGQISVASEVGKGSTFTVEVPLQPVKSVDLGVAGVAGQYLRAG